MAEGKLIVNVGAGRSHEIERSAAAGYRGTVENVLRRLAAEHVRDAEMAAYLDDSDVVYENTTADGAERRVGPGEEWQDVVDSLEELWVARTHRGGIEVR